MSGGGLEAIRKVLAEPQDVGLPDDMQPGQADPYGADNSAPDYAGPGGDDGPPAPTEAPPPEQLCAELPLNDVGNGRRFVIHFGDNAVWVPRVGWFRWTGTVWLKDPDMIGVRGLAQKISALIEAETRYIAVPPAKAALVDMKATVDDRLGVLTANKDRTAAEETELLALKEQRDEITAVLGGVKDRIGQRLRHAKNAGNSGPINNMLQEGGITLACALDRLDAAAMEVNTLSGVLRFEMVDDFALGVGQVPGVTLLPHQTDSGPDLNRPLMMTKMMPVAYDPDAKCPRFDAFLERIMPSRDMREFLMRWFGLCMTALTGEQKLCYFYGNGANGKSVLVDVIARICGDYAATAKIESLTGSNRRGGGDATPDLVPLIGARMVRASEPDEGMRWQEGLIKELTGGEEILVRALHSDFVAVRPQFKLTISGNHKPDIRGTDDGIWRRLLLIPFDEQIPVAERVPKNELDALLFEERAGILNRMVAGLLDYMGNGLREPQQVLLATKEFREASDPYGAFLDDACVVTGDPVDTVPARELVQAFHFWLACRGEGAFKDRTVALALKDRSARWRSPKTRAMFTVRKASTMYYDGVRFTDLFKRDFDLAPRDHTGRVMMTREAGTEA